MKEVKTTIPNNCELVKEGDSYVVKEKKNNPPRSWEEFCENYPINNKEFFIMGGNNNISSICEGRRSASNDKNLCINKEEAEAFLALMQLRQLRKAWVGDWKQENSQDCATIVHDLKSDSVITYYSLYWASSSLSFPSTAMAEDFLSCFRYLCETAKILL